MSDLITAVTTTITGIFTAIVTAFSDIGNLIFTFTEGAITGISPFGYFLALLIGIPAGTWLFNKLFNLLKGLIIGRAK